MDFDDSREAHVQQAVIGWVLEYAVRHKIHSVTAALLSQHKDVISAIPGIQVQLACLAVHRIITGSHVDQFEVAINILDHIYTSCPDALQFKLYSKLSVGLKMLVLLKMLKNREKSALIKLMEYFPREPTFANACSKQVSVLCDVYRDFRKFFLPMLASQSQAEEYFRQQFDEEYGPEFHHALCSMSSLLFDKILGHFPPSLLKEILSTPEKLGQCGQSPCIKVLQDVIQKKATLDEKDLREIITKVPHILSILRSRSSDSDEQIYAEDCSVETEIIHVKNHCNKGLKCLSLPEERISNVSSCRKKGFLKSSHSNREGIPDDCSQDVNLVNQKTADIYFCKDNSLNSEIVDNVQIMSREQIHGDSAFTPKSMDKMLTRRKKHITSLCKEDLSGKLLKTVLSVVQIPDTSTQTDISSSSRDQSLDEISHKDKSNLIHEESTEKLTNTVPHHTEIPDKSGLSHEESEEKLTNTVSDHIQIPEITIHTDMCVSDTPSLIDEYIAGKNQRKSNVQKFKQLQKRCNKKSSNLSKHCRHSHRFVDRHHYPQQRKEKQCTNPKLDQMTKIRQSLKSNVTSNSVPFTNKAKRRIGTNLMHRIRLRNRKRKVHRKDFPIIDEELYPRIETTRSLQETFQSSRERNADNSLHNDYISDEIFILEEDNYEDDGNRSVSDVDRIDEDEQVIPSSCQVELENVFSDDSDAEIRDPKYSIPDIGCHIKQDSTQLCIIKLFRNKVIQHEGHSFVIYS